MQRRAFLAAGVALAAGPGMRAWPALGQEGVNGLIDVHCHVFNDSDIPGWSFFWS